MTTSSGEQRLHERIDNLTTTVNNFKDEIKTIIANNHAEQIERMAVKPCGIHDEKIKSLRNQMKWTWKGLVGGALALLGLALKTLWSGPGN